MDLDKIDGEFSGPRGKIRRDWSATPIARLSDVRSRSFLPAFSQIKKVVGESVTPPAQLAVKCNYYEQLRT